MASDAPTPISPAESLRRREVVVRAAAAVGFVGRIEYRHAASQSGGARYERGAVQGEDVLAVYAEAFDRDADPDDFSLQAIIAHERGHQLLAWHPRLSILTVGISLPAEEVLACLLGALVLEPGLDRESLVAKATFDLLKSRTEEDASRLIEHLWRQLGALL